MTATGAADAALAAWETWKERNDVGSVDRGAKRLLPLVYRRLTELRVDDPDLGRLKDLYLHAWYRNQVKFRWAAEAVGRLREAGLDVMLLKGAALVGSPLPRRRSPPDGRRRPSGARRVRRSRARCACRAGLVAGHDCSTGGLPRRPACRGTCSPRRGDARPALERAPGSPAPTVRSGRPPSRRASAARR